MKFIFGFFVGLLTGALMVLGPILAMIATAIAVITAANQSSEEIDEPQTKEEILAT